MSRNIDYREPSEQHGGSRPGAGRKPFPDGKGRSVPKSIRVSQDVADYLSDVGSGIVEEVVRKSKGFRDWVAQKYF